MIIVKITVVVGDIDGRGTTPGFQRREQRISGWTGRSGIVL